MEQTDDGIPTTECTGPNCKRKIVWGLNEHGRKVPLDAVAPVYKVIRVDADGQAIVRREERAFVSHFNTCKDVSLFSKRR